MQSINKIHINNSTEMSLNDRFTIMQRNGGSTSNSLNEPRRRIRMRSTSKSRILLNQPAASTPNRRLLEQLEKKHKMRAALKLKRVNYFFQHLNKNKSVKLASSIKINLLANIL